MRHALSLLIFGAAVVSAEAAELKVYSPPFLRPALTEVVALHERKTGDKVSVDYLSRSATENLLDKGEPVDVVVNNGPVTDKYVARGLLGEARPVGSARVVMAYRKGQPAPDGSSAEGVGKAVAAAKTVAVSDPKYGGNGATLYADTIKKLGIEADANGKAMLTEPAVALIPVDQGRADIGIGLSTEALGLANVSLVPFLPADPRSRVTMIVSVSTKARNQDAARAFAQTLTSDEAAAIFEKHGLGKD